MFRHELRYSWTDIIRSSCRRALSEYWKTGKKPFLWVHWSISTVVVSFVDGNSIHGFPGSVFSCKCNFGDRLGLIVFVDLPRRSGYWEQSREAKKDHHQTWTSCTGTNRVWIHQTTAKWRCDFTGGTIRENVEESYESFFSLREKWNHKQMMGMKFLLHKNHIINKLLLILTALVLLQCFFIYYIKNTFQSCAYLYFYSPEGL